MKVRFCLGLMAAGTLFAVGCGTSGPAEVPKNPVTIEKPGAAAADPGGTGKGGGALPNQQAAQPLK